MEIAENNAQHITLVENAGPWAVFMYVWIVVLGALFTVIGVWLLFSQVSELVAPAWAEANGLSGRRWRGEGSGVPTSLAFSVAISFFWTAFSLTCLRIGGTRVLFSIRQRLEFDFSNGQVTLKRRGLIGCTDRTHPISGTIARIEEVDDDGSKFQVLCVTAVPDEDQRGWSDLLPWRHTLWREEVEPDQVKTLGRLL